MTDTDKRATHLLKDNPPARPLEGGEQSQDRARILRHGDQPYRPMVEHSLGLICTHDFEGALLYVNPAAAQALGYPANAWMGRNLHDFLAPSFQPFFAEYLQRIQQQGSDEGFMRVVTATGEPRLWRYHNICYEEDGPPLYVIGCAQDVTEQIRLERALRKAHDELEQRVEERTAELREANAALGESEERYRNLFDNANDVITTLAMDGTITSINRAAEAFFGWSREEIVGKNFRVATTPEMVARVEERRHLFLAGTKLTSNLEVEVFRKDGSMALLEGRTRSMHDKDGQLIGVQAIFRDITERKRGEEQLRAAKEAAEEADRAKSEFLALMNHELRTPLSVMTGYLDLLLSGTFGPLNEEQRSVIQRLHANTNSVVDLISGVLNLNRLDAGHLVVERTEVSIARMLQELERETSGARELSGLRFIWRTERDLPTLFSDSEKLKVVIRNLLNNAIKFTRVGEIIVGAHRKEDAIEIYVADTGVGITPEQQSVIFEAFRQGEAVNARGLTGVGLGLYIVKRLLDLLGGTVSVQSEIGKGSVFSVRLPLRIPHMAVSPE